MCAVEMRACVSASKATDKTDVGQSHYAAHHNHRTDMVRARRDDGRSGVVAHGFALFASCQDTSKKAEGEAGIESPSPVPIPTSSHASTSPGPHAQYSPQSLAEKPHQSSPPRSKSPMPPTASLASAGSELRKQEQAAADPLNASDGAWQARLHVVVYSDSGASQTMQGRAVWLFHCRRQRWKQR